MDLHVLHVLDRIVHELDGGDFVWRDMLVDADAFLVVYSHLLAHISPQLEESQHHGNDDGRDIKMHLSPFFFRLGLVLERGGVKEIRQRRSLSGLHFAVQWPMQPSLS